MDLIFHPEKGSHFTIEVGFFDTISEIKEKIQKLRRIPAAAQTLIFAGKVLPDDVDVHNSDILHNSHIHLVVSAAAPTSPPRRKPLRVHVKFRGSDAPGISLEVDPSDTVRALKERINEEAGGKPNPRRISVHVNGSELSDSRAVADYELPDGVEIDVAVKRPSPATSSGSSGSGSVGPKKHLRVTVVSKCGTKRYAVEVNPAENVGELRKELEKMKRRKEEEMELPEEGYFFIYKQNVMDDDRSFRWHNVGPGDTIEIFNGSVTGGL
ncbi:unnamed protein product [Cuscuta campestris]|uniref:Ubiquitin-like domain-containing protein n=1 Tax=Cuscuta campestris TaxID=132261 RepID=A0A484MXF9_9ASTE|nr:unnamed protein product [Cuscuta campestris]